MTDIFRSGRVNVFARPDIRMETADEKEAYSYGKSIRYWFTPRGILG